MITEKQKGEHTGGEIPAPTEINRTEAFKLYQVPAREPKVYLEHWGYVSQKTACYMLYHMELFMVFALSIPDTTLSETYKFTNLCS